MTIWKRAGSALCGAVAVAAVVGLSAAPAMAMPASTTLKAKVSGGGSITATSAETVLTDNGISVTCQASNKKSVISTAKGSISNGTHSGPAPLKVGITKSLNFKDCTGPLGKVSNTPGDFSKTTYLITVDSKTTSKGDTDGIIGPVSVAVSIKGGCSFTVTGSAPGYYSNSKHLLVLTPKLPTKASKKAQLTIGNVKNASLCLGAVKDGQHPTYTGTYKVSKKVKISVS
jgi:hypothetical protein